MPVEPEILQGLAMDWSQRSGAAQGLDEAVGFIQKFSTRGIPDVGPARKALEAWGIPFAEGGEPIRQMFTSTPTLKVALPEGWEFSSRGGGGHMELMDERGASRLRWYVHGWDPICLSINCRFIIRTEDVSATEDVCQVIDGSTVIHVIPVKYPVKREFRRYSDGSSGYIDPDDAGLDNYRVREAAREAGKAWLDANRPGHLDDLKSWTL